MGREKFLRNELRLGGSVARQCSVHRLAGELAIGAYHRRIPEREEEEGQARIIRERRGAET